MSFRYRKKSEKHEKWHNLKCASISLDNVGVTELEREESYDPKKKVKTKIPCLDIVKQSNASMGRFDVPDMLTELYETPVTTKT